MDNNPMGQQNGENGMGQTPVNNGMPMDQTAQMNAMGQTGSMGQANSMNQANTMGQASGQMGQPMMQANPMGQTMNPMMGQPMGAAPQFANLNGAKPKGQMNTLIAVAIGTIAIVILSIVAVIITNNLSNEHATNTVSCTAIDDGASLEIEILVDEDDKKVIAYGAEGLVSVNESTSSYSYSGTSYYSDDGEWVSEGTSSGSAIAMTVATMGEIYERYEGEPGITYRSNLTDDSYSFTFLSERADDMPEDLEEQMDAYDGMTAEEIVDNGGYGKSSTVIGSNSLECKVK